MAGSSLKIDIRRKKILEELRRDGRVNVTRLSRELQATPVTIRNDLTALQADGHLLRVSGGAVAVTKSSKSTAYQVAQPDLRYEEKKAIAQAVAEQLEDGQTLFLNSGTTTQLIAEMLKSHKNMRIVTNSLAVASALGDVPTFCVILLGGEVNAQYGFTYGGDAQEQLERYQADYAILSVDSIGAKNGVTTFHAEEAIINKIMIGCANETLIVADASKVGRAGFSRVCECAPHLTLFTTAEPWQDDVKVLSAAGVKVHSV